MLLPALRRLGFVSLDLACATTSGLILTARTMF
jgi:hypothetical protein